MLDARDITNQVTFKRTICLNNFNKTNGKGPKGTTTIDIAKEAVVKITEPKVEER